MRLSQLFTHTFKDQPAGETAKNAQLLMRAGFIHKEMAGVYAYLPLGLRVLEKIKGIVREEMNGLGAQELIMSSLQRRELWQKTDRWDDRQVDIWFKSNLKNGSPVGFGWSHEEPVAEMMKNFVSSYRELPVGVYQFQTKLRNELRAKSGVMRGREFVMKDLYSFSRTENEHQTYYDRVRDTYLRIFQRVGLGEATYLTFASGGAFTRFSHEFQTLCDAGEDIIYLDRDKGLAINQEVLSDEVISRVGLTKDRLEKVKAAEVGNIFSFGSKKSEQLGLYYVDEDGQTKPVILGSYGIGITRLMGVIVERLADDRGLVWPAAVAPAKVYLMAIGEDRRVMAAADQLYADLLNAGVEVLYDDRTERAGSKFADCDLIGLPWRAVVSPKLFESAKIELKNRSGAEASLLTAEEIIKKLAGK